MEREFLVLNGVRFVQVEAAIQKMVTTVLSYGDEEDPYTYDGERLALEFCRDVLGSDTPEYEFFKREYVHRKYPKSSK